MEFIKCSRCHSELLEEYFKVNRKGTLNKCCNNCLASANKYKCDKCDSVFTTKGYLQRHIKTIHDKIKDFECSLCEYKCSENSSLKQHIKSVHDKIKDFKCSLCEYKCFNNSGIKRTY